jgi:hypothetical protein
MTHVPAPPAPGGITRIPLNIDAIAGRALAAPGGQWEAFTDMLWIPWFAGTDDEFTDDDTGSRFNCGRWLAVREGGWHTGSEDPPPGLWAFLATARDDVLALTAEVRRLRAALADSRTARIPARGTVPHRDGRAPVPAAAGASSGPPS